MKSRKADEEEVTPTVSNCENENKSQIKRGITTKASEKQIEENDKTGDGGPKADPDNLEVVAPEGTSFEFLTQPASMEEESYVEIIPPEIEASQNRISGEIENEITTADATKNKTYASVVSENNVQDKPDDVSVITLDETSKNESVILCDSPIDDSVVILEKTNFDDSVIICDEEINSVRYPAPVSTRSRTRSPSPNRESSNDNKRITRGSLKNETEDKEQIVLLKTDDVAEKDSKILEESDFTDSDESDSGESAESVDTQVTTDLEKSEVETSIKGVLGNSENSDAAEEPSKDKLNESLKIDLRPSWQAKK